MLVRSCTYPRDALLRMEGHSLHCTTVTLQTPWAFHPLLTVLLNKLVSATVSGSFLSSLGPQFIRGKGNYHTNHIEFGCRTINSQTFQTVLESRHFENLSQPKPTFRPSYYKSTAYKPWALGPIIWSLSLFPFNTDLIPAPCSVNWLFFQFISTSSSKHLAVN